MQKAKEHFGVTERQRSLSNSCQSALVEFSATPVSIELRTGREKSERRKGSASGLSAKNLRDENGRSKSDLKTLNSV